MRLLDKDHFWCPDCSSLLPREMFSCHPAACTNKTQPKLANKEKSIYFIEQSREETCQYSSSSQINELKQSDPGFYTLIKDKPFTNLTEKLKNIPNIAIDTFVSEIKYTCQFCDFY